MRVGPPASRRSLLRLYDCGTSALIDDAHEASRVAGVELNTAIRVVGETERRAARRRCELDDRTARRIRETEEHRLWIPNAVHRLRPVHQDLRANTALLVDDLEASRAKYRRDL